jgi:hypothetical protein
MLSLLVYFRNAWNDYFTGNPTQISQKEFGTTQNPSAASVYVSNCLFRSITLGSNGGALFCSTSVTYLLVESSSFYSCKTSSSGGAIYFRNTGSGQCVLYKLCGYDCSSNGMFYRVDMYNSLTSKNYVNYSSFSRCVNENSNAWNMLCHLYGRILCPSVNVSINKCSGRSGIYCEPFGDSNNVTCSLSYSTYADNNSTQYTCIFFSNSAANIEIKSCNILRNRQDSLNSEGTIFTRGNTNIEDSCILMNRANYIFYQATSSNTITVSNCTVDSTSSSGNFVIQNTVTKSFILALKHMSTRNCHSEYDSVGTLTPLTPPLSL